MTGIDFTATIAADPAEAEALCRRLRILLARLPEKRDRFAVELLCREALANAIEHSCHYDGSKRVSLELRTVSGGIVAKIRDDGDGFAYTQNDEADGPAPATRERGRGLRILRLYADSLSFYDAGRTIVLERNMREENR